ncbi:nucleotidyltransferase domain-containing protein [Pantoea leporis]|uniref:Nucleotidyltransferase domain-containing protein n=1 Tax=Pantoea leporis TaxID=2933780 RepID=A0ABV2E2E4_9GAMM
MCITTMKLLCLALYGSCARGDQTEGSDVDLFAIHDQDEYRMTINGNVNTALYPEKKALQMMHSGNLFALHLKMESKAIFNEGKLISIFEEFKFKEDYQYEILMAAKLGRDTLSLSEKIKNNYMFNRKISWCVRTILIASSAQNRHPIFSKTELTQSLNNWGVDKSNALKLLELKNNTKKDNTTYFIAKRFFDNFVSEQQTIISEIENDSFYKKSIKAMLSDASHHDDSY